MSIDRSISHMRYSHIDRLKASMTLGDTVARIAWGNLVQENYQTLPVLRRTGRAYANACSAAMQSMGVGPTDFVLEGWDGTHKVLRSAIEFAAVATFGPSHMFKCELPRAYVDPHLDALRRMSMVDTLGGHLTRQFQSSWGSQRHFYIGVLPDPSSGDYSVVGHVLREEATVHTAIESAAATVSYWRPTDLRYIHHSASGCAEAIAGSFHFDTHERPVDDRLNIASTICSLPVLRRAQVMHRHLCSALASSPGGRL